LIAVDEKRPRAKSKRAEQSQRTLNVALVKEVHSPAEWSGKEAQQYYFDWCK
jgi:hypothetical protein